MGSTIAFDAPNDSERCIIPWGIYDLEIANNEDSTTFSREFSIDLRTTDWINPPEINGDFKITLHNYIERDSVGLICQLNSGDPATVDPDTVFKIWEVYKADKIQYTLLVPTTISTSIAGLSFTMDDTTFTSSQTRNWGWTTSHDLVVENIQWYGGDKYTFERWCNGISDTSQAFTVDSTQNAFNVIAVYEKYEATMTGPTSLDEYENGTFTAIPSGGVTPYGYTWYRMEGIGTPDRKSQGGGTRRPPVGVWVYHSSGSATAVSNGVAPGFKMKVVVEDDDEDTVTVIKTIYISEEKSGQAAADADASLAPAEFALEQNFPNPFNPETSLRYSLPEACPVTMSVYDISGRHISVLVDEEQTAGFHTVTWEGRDDAGQAVPSGLYIGLLRAGSYREKIKMMLVR